MRQFFLYLTAILGATVLALAQSPVDNTARFKLASIKPAVHHDVTGCIGAMCGGGRSTDDPSFQYLQTRLLEVLEWAYGKTSFQIYGPDWLAAHDSPRFDIVATAPPTTSDEQFRVMLQNLLVDQMGLKVHHEIRTLPIYRLKIAEGGFKLNPAPKTEQGARGSSANHHFRLSTEDVASMKTLSGALQNFVHESVVDETGLTGMYRFNLQWSDAAPTDGATPLPDLGMALDHLGLKLEKSTQDFDVLVVDHIEKAPAGN